jgi:hypothetical protein
LYGKPVITAHGSGTEAASYLAYTAYNDDTATSEVYYLRYKHGDGLVSTPLRMTSLDSLGKTEPLIAGHTDVGGVIGWRLVGLGGPAKTANISYNMYATPFSQIISGDRGWASGIGQTTDLASNGLWVAGVYLDPASPGGSRIIPWLSMNVYSTFVPMTMR